MKPITLLISLVCGFLLVITTLAAFASGAISDLTGTAADTWKWMSEHWSVIALLVSEIAALLPTKASGIVHWFVRVFGKLLTKE